MLDADLGLANIDVLLGITANRNLQDVLSGDCDLKDVLVNGPGGIKIVPASSGTQRMTQLSAMEHAGLINAFSELGDQIDVLIVDTAAGISESVVSFLRASQELLLVVCDEPTSITDAYALIKLMNRDYGTNRFRILANQVRNEQEGRHLFEKLTRVTERFLDVALQYVGIVPYDEAVKKAVQRQKAVLDAYPRAKASLAIRLWPKKWIAGLCRPLPGGGISNSSWSGSSKSDLNPVLQENRIHDIGETSGNLPSGRRQEPFSPD